MARKNEKKVEERERTPKATEDEYRKLAHDPRQVFEGSVFEYVADIL